MTTDEIEAFYKNQFSDYSQSLYSYINQIKNYNNSYCLKDALNHATGNAINSNTRTIGASIVVLCCS